jgi:phosphomannomutase
VIEHKADLGIIFDTDVDRGAAVDCLGQPLNRNRLIALISAIVLREHPGSTIVTDSVTSDGLTQFIEGDLRGVHHRFKRGYKNVIDEAIRLNQSDQDCWLAIETSGHGAMKENYFLDDGAYLVSKLLVELARMSLEGKALSDLIATLKEPKESEEFRIKLTAKDFKSYGQNIIEQLQDFTQSQPSWKIVPNNHEGVRVSCLTPQEDGWFLLRLSLHDPVVPLNVESNVLGGVAQIKTVLLQFFRQFEDLDLSALL